MTIPIRYPALELGVGVVFGLIAGLARPTVVPVLLVTSAGVIATASSWLMHGRFSGRVALPSAVLAVFMALGTVVIELT